MSGVVVTTPIAYPAAATAEAVEVVKKLADQGEDEAALEGQLNTMMGGHEEAKAEAEKANLKAEKDENSRASGDEETARKARLVRALTWNIAAVNNNPFEYWITHEDEGYSRLMAKVEAFVSNTGDQDILVESIFTSDMFAELKADMTNAGWTGLEKVEDMWKSDIKVRKIISGFLKDNLLGKKRLASMPDRYTNTVNTADGDVQCRPTVINCYEGDLGSTAKWWSQWRSFMFEKEVKIANSKTKAVENKRICQLLPPIKHAKYPDITPEEEEISIPLQTLCCAIFDAIMVHMMNTLAPDTWQGLRKEMCEALNKNKSKRTLDILDYKNYHTADVWFLQECSTAFATKAKERFKGRLTVHLPSAMDATRDQNSVIFTKTGAFSGFLEVTDEVMVQLKAKNPKAHVEPGDLFVLSAVDDAGVPYLLASFHGDANGLATVAVVTAVHDTAQASFPHHRLLFGLDGNTKAKHEPSKQQGLQEFAAVFAGFGMASSWGPVVDATKVTTFNARTYLQTQLNKAIKMSERHTKGDRNLKDYILFYSSQFDTVSNARDNTGRRVFVDNTVMPSLEFPSDHCILDASLAIVAKP